MLTSVLSRVACFGAYLRQICSALADELPWSWFRLLSGRSSLWSYWRLPFYHGKMIGDEPGVLTY